MIFRTMPDEHKNLKHPITYWIGEGGSWLLQHVVSYSWAESLIPF
jgi:hypothetical protein